LNPQLLPFKESAFTNFATGVLLEVRVGFEPTVLGICSPLHWATLPPYYCLATPHGDDPRSSVLETNVLPT